MRTVRSTRRLGISMVWVVALALLPGDRAEAQARRFPQRQGGNFPATSLTDRIGVDRDRNVSHESAAATVASPFAVFGQSGDTQIRRYRGDNNEFGGVVAGPQGVNVGGSGGGGFTMDRVHEGWYMPGSGSNNGFAAPERVHGGFYTPGWGVMGGRGDFNGPAVNEWVRGGTYLPGFGVHGGSSVIHGGGPAMIGHFGNPVVGNSAAPVGASVHGGSYVPGFGVTGGR